MEKSDISGSSFSNMLIKERKVKNFACFESFLINNNLSLK